MAIQIVCPGCHKRFQVSEKFAGKQGPCPQCKTVIKIPSESEEVKVHAPEGFGPTDSSGRPTLKPISKEYSKFSPVIFAGSAAGVAMVFVVALVIRMQFDNPAEMPLMLLGLGAFTVAPPLVWAGYSFLRDDELAPHQGTSLWVRVLICSVVYAVIWGVIAVFNWQVFENEGFPMPMLAVFVPLMAVGGAATAFASLDLEYFMGLFHYGLYLVATVLLRLLVGMSAFPIAE